jgi:hypothetical protein
MAGISSMMHHASPAPLAEAASADATHAPPAAGRLRYRVLAALTLLFLAAWCAWGWWVYDTYIPRLELSRAIGYLMASGMGGGMKQNGDGDPAAGMRRATIVTEVVRHTWVALMALAAAVMLTAGAVAVSGPHRGRRWLLVAGFFIIVATIGTMAGILVLIRFGDFPRMKAPAYVLITGAQSSLGWILVFTCRRRQPDLRAASQP